MFALRQSVIMAAYLAGAIASSSAFAGAKDESAAEWLAPKWLNEWHDGLAAKGLNFGAVWIGDNITNVTGGTSRGAIHFGRFDVSVDGDLEKLVGWTGGKFYVNALGIYGRGLSRNYVHNLATISEIEAQPEARLYNAYFEQGFYNNALNFRIGQQAADVEFFDSQTDDLFINGTFGWPANKANNLPSGGPAPPIAVPGIRVKATLSDQVTLFGAVFNGNAARPGDGDPQFRDNHGLAFRVNDPPWLIGQVRWSYDLDFGKGPLAGNFTPGGWYHTGQFDDQRFTAQGASIADPSGTGIAARMRGNFGIFAVVEQTLYRPPSVTEKGVSASLPGVTAFADRLQSAGSQPDRPLCRRRHRCHRPGPGPPARPVRDGSGLYADFQCSAKPRPRHPVLCRPAKPGAQQRDAARDDLRGASQARLAAGALLSICVPPLRRHPESERSDRPVADRRRRGVRDHHHA
jgi:porin